MDTYDSLREHYKPATIALLLITESPPPANPDTPSSRHFYRADRIRRDDRLFTNTIKALYPEAAGLTEAEIQPNKEAWLHRLQTDGIYIIEALQESQPHKASKEQRQERIRKQLPELIARVRKLAAPATKIILIKSNVFEVASGPLRQAGFTVLNTELVDYPGRFNQRDYREKLSKLAKQ